MSEVVLHSPFLWISATIIAYAIGLFVNQKLGKPIFSPILIGAIILITCLSVLGVPSTVYDESVTILTFFLIPITCVLAIPIYRKFEILKQNFFPIIMGSFAGSLMSIVSVTYLSRLFGLDDILYRSLIAKSVTSPIAISLTENLGGLISIIMLGLTAAGLTGATILPEILKFFKITDNIALGVAMGTSSHAVGTSRAVKINETVGAMSGLSIGVTGIITSFLVSIIYF